RAARAPSHAIPPRLADPPPRQHRLPAGDPPRPRAIRSSLRLRGGREGGHAQHRPSSSGSLPPPHRLLRKRFPLPRGRGRGTCDAPSAPPPVCGGGREGARAAPISFATEPAPTPPLAPQAVPPSPAGGGGAVVSFACGEGRLPFELGGEDHRGGGALHAVDRANAVGELVHVTHG